MALRIRVLIAWLLATPLLFAGTSAAATPCGEKASGTGGFHGISRVAIQVSSFRKARDAVREVAHLRARGVDAVSSYEAVRGKGMWHRVYVPGFATIKEARDAARKLKKRRVISGYWIRHVRGGQSGARSDGPPLATPVAQAEPRQPRQPVGVAMNATPARTPGSHQVAETDNRPQKAEAEAGKGKAHKDRFSLALRLGALYCPDLDRFKVRGPSGTWHFNEKYLNGAIVPSLRVNDSIFLEGSVEQTLNSKFDFWYVTLGPKLKLPPFRLRTPFIHTPYIRAALAWGDMSWDDLPGRFDDAFGWEVGGGVETTLAAQPRLKLGIDISYRDIAFDYDLPSAPGWTTTRGSIDFSGFSFTASLVLSF